MNFAFTTIRELRKQLDEKKISRQELLREVIQYAAQHDTQVQSLLEVFDEDSILQSTAQDAHSSLAGIPGAIKDNICQQGRKATCASKMLENFTSTYDATAITRLKDAGALLLGRANMDEFAMGSSTETSYFAKTTNPWNAKCVPGGSSGGSAAAVAAGIVPWALGSDTGGSVRQPAALCGVVGLKPTYGSISRYGLIAYASSLDQIGIFSRDVYDAATVFSTLSGRDQKDATTHARKPHDYTQDIENKPATATIGVVKNALYAEGMDPEIQQAIVDALKVYESMGYTIKELELPALDYSAACYFILSRAQAASNLARFDGVRYGYRAKEAANLHDLYVKSRGQGFGKEVQVRIMVGNYVLSAGHAGKYYNNAKLVQQKIRKEFLDAFKDVDALIMPTHAAPAFTFGAFDDNKLQMDLQDYFTAGVNLAGLPGLSLPCGLTKSGMPMGMQLIGPHFSEQALFALGHAYQQNTDWHTKKPQL